MLRRWRRISLVEILKKKLFFFFFWVVLPCTRYRVRVSCSRSCVLYLTKSMDCVFSATLECTSHYLLYSSALVRVVLLFFSSFFWGGFTSSLGYIRFVFSFLFFFRGICVFVPPPSLRNYISSLFKK